MPFGASADGMTEGVRRILASPVQGMSRALCASPRCGVRARRTKVFAIVGKNRDRGGVSLAPTRRWQARNEPDGRVVAHAYHQLYNPPASLRSAPSLTQGGLKQGNFPKRTFKLWNCLTLSALSGGGEQVLSCFSGLPQKSRQRVLWEEERQAQRVMRQTKCAADQNALPRRGGALTTCELGNGTLCVPFQGSRADAQQMRGKISSAGSTTREAVEQSETEGVALL